MMKKILFLVMAILAAASMMIAGCGGGDKKAAEPEKVLRVGTEPTFAPFEFQKEGSKSYDGFDMDLARAIGKQMGYKVEIVSMGFDALIPALNSGNIDVVAAGMSINEERQKAVTFSEPYYTSGLIVMVNKDNNEVKSVKDAIISEFGGFAVEMEGAAIGQAAYLNHIPFLVVRAISDKADGSAHMDYAEFEMAAIEHSVKLTVRMIQEL